MRIERGDQPFDKLRGTCKSNLPHDILPDLTVDALGLAREEGLAVTVRDGMSLQDMPGVADDLPRHGTDHLVVGLLLGKFPCGPFPEGGAFLRSHDALCRFDQKRLHVLASALRDLAVSAFLLVAFLGLSASVDTGVQPVVRDEVLGRAS